MTLHQSFRKFLALIFLLFLASNFSLPASAFSISAEQGSVKTEHTGNNGKTIYLIQEAHVDYGAQKSIAEILKFLIEVHELRLVLVEGGWGNVNLDYLRSYGSPEGRIQVAEQYLKDGKISAEEYLNVTTELPMELWGIEDKELYDANMTAFLTIHEKQEGLLKELEKLKQDVAAQSEKIFSEELKSFLKKKEAFEEHQIGLIEYLMEMSYLSSPGLTGGFIERTMDSRFRRADSSVPDVQAAVSRMTNRRGNDIKMNYPHLSKILAASGQDSSFDAAKIDIEKRELIKALSNKITKPEFELLSVLSDKKSTEEEIQFLQSLFETLARFPKLEKKLKLANLKAYAKAMEEVNGVESDRIFKELEQIEIALGDKLANTPEAKELLANIRTLDSLKKLFELKLGPREYASLDKELNVGATRRVAPTLDSAIPLARAFYTAAIAREEALIRNAIEKFESTGDPAGRPYAVAAMIIGGFHSKAVADAFKNKGYSVFLITPRLNSIPSPEHQNKYFEILKYKWNPNLNSIPSGGVTQNAIQKTN